MNLKRAASRIVLCLLPSVLFALELPPGGTDLKSELRPRTYVNKEVGSAGTLGEAGAFVDVTQPDESKSYAAQFVMPLPGIAVEKNDRILLVLRARAVGTEKGAFLAKLQLKEAPYRTVGPTPGIDVSAQWQDYPILFAANDSLPLNKAEITLLCGDRRQRLEIESARVWRYPASVPLDRFPKIPRTYPGREPDAAWRREALERIERDRKGDFAVAIRETDGTPVRNLPVKLTLRRHAFGFGSATPVKWYLDESEDGRRWREIVDNYFSLIVFENDLKDFDWYEHFSLERKADRNARLDRALDWLAQRHIAVRGHYLMQAATPPNLTKTSNDAIRAHFLAATRERLQFIGNRVVEWDVINHPIAWGGADMLTARPALAQLDREVFDLARTLTKLPLLVNEDQLFRPGRQSDNTYDYVKALVDAGYPVAGVGNQAHIHESYLPSPMEVLKVTDRFAKIVPRQVITEFDVVTSNDEDLAADYTRDLLIACFSHPAYSGFLWWGFWEGAHWKPEAASWTRDWTPRKRADVFREWIGGKWRTEVSVVTDDQGIARWRGFPGWYEVRMGEQSMPMIEAQLTQHTPR